MSNRSLLVGCTLVFLPVCLFLHMRAKTCGRGVMCSFFLYFLRMITPPRANDRVIEFEGLFFLWRCGRILEMDMDEGVM